MPSLQAETIGILILIVAGIAGIYAYLAAQALPGVIRDIHWIYTHRHPPDDHRLN